MKEKGLQTVSINTRLRAIRAFFNFLHRERIFKKSIKLHKSTKRP